MQENRRSFLVASAVLGASALGTMSGIVRANTTKNSEKQSEVEISAPEDLMREHGVLMRILLIYEEGIRRAQSNENIPFNALHDTAMLVRAFIENYHEKLEEDFIFPEFRKSKQMVDLVTVLKSQHDAGRKLTDVILRISGEKAAGDASRQELISAGTAFVRMYRPHMGREDTVLFPALYKVIGQERVKNLGEQFEKEEHRILGENGFAANVEKVAAIEKQLGIYDLAAFTPK